MNASLPPEDERREEANQQSPPKTSPTANSGVGLGSFLLMLFVVGMVVVVVLPMLPLLRPTAQRSTQTEMEQRQHFIEQAEREASHEDGLADNR